MYWTSKAYLSKIWNTFVILCFIYLSFAVISTFSFLLVYAAWNKHFNPQSKHQNYQSDGGTGGVTGGSHDSCFQQEEGNWMQHQCSYNPLVIIGWPRSKLATTLTSLLYKAWSIYYNLAMKSWLTPQHSIVWSKWSPNITLIMMDEHID